MDRKETSLTRKSQPSARVPTSSEAQPIEDVESEIVLQDLELEDDLRISLTRDRSLGDFIFTVWKIQRDKLETEDLFEAVKVITERERKIDDLKHRRRMTNFLFGISGAAFFLVLLRGLKLIELPVGFTISVGSISGLAAVVLRHLVRRKSTR
jgi:hypothetical protein